MDDQTIHPAVGGKEAGYLLEFLEDGVYLSIYPDQGDGILFELSDIRKILNDNGVIDYDIIELSRIVREAAGEPRKLSDQYVDAASFVSEDSDPEAEAPVEEDGEATIVVEVSPDRLTATVQFDTKSGHRLPSADAVQVVLADKGIIHGLDENAIREGVDSLTPFVAARGEPAVNGEDARIERHFDLGEKGRPKVEAYDRVNYKDMNLFVFARKGDVLAERILQTEGVPGKDVYGNDIPAKNGKPIPIPQGKNTEILNEKALVASIDGQIVDNGKKIEVDPHLVVKGGVGVGSGNIDFAGSVEVKGNVETGFSVKATGDIEISGMVNGGDVDGRNVFIRGGVNGMSRGLVRAKEDVRAVFAENAEIEADRDIYLSDVSLHSTLRAGKRIYIEEKRGMIAGGIAAAGEEIRCKCVGNPVFVVTRLSVGVNPNLEKHYKELCKQYKEDNLRLKQITQMLNTLGKIDVSRLPQQRIDQINELTRSQFPLAGKIKRAEKEIQSVGRRTGQDAVW
ncbi:MAG: FapA family protein [Selenomonas sp.]|jgi:uncharacterized protein (DUF342 family)|nr:FapA family protein [Selenomonas sp.]